MQSDNVQQTDVQSDNMQQNDAQQGKTQSEILQQDGERVARSGPPSTATDLEKMGSGAMFDAIAHRYDMLNRVLSLGVDQGWRRRTVEALDLPSGARVLDVATGTGDLALRIARIGGVQVDGVDPSTNMLALAQEKAVRAETPNVSFHEGDAQALPYANDTFDACCIAFGIRNVPDRRAGVREMARVTKAGGRVAILELSEPRSGILGPLARFHIRQVVPWVGGVLSGAREYRYLQQSVAAFPPPEEFAALLEDCGLNVLRVESLTFGVCCLYVCAVSQQ